MGHLKLWEAALISALVTILGLVVCHYGLLP